MPKSDAMGDLNALIFIERRRSDRCRMVSRVGYSTENHAVEPETARFCAKTWTIGRNERCRHETCITEKQLNFVTRPTVGPNGKGSRAETGVVKRSCPLCAPV